jgi:hypothetical protein
MINLDRVSEGIDYELIPVDYVDNTQAWDVRILRGQFCETVIRYGTISFDGNRDCLTFDFRVVTSPDPDLEAEESKDLQEFAGDVLEDILARGLSEGWVKGVNKEDDGNSVGTNDSEESTD